MIRISGLTLRFGYQPKHELSAEIAFANQSVEPFDFWLVVRK